MRDGNSFTDEEPRLTSSAGVFPFLDELGLSFLGNVTSFFSLFNFFRVVDFFFLCCQSIRIQDIRSDRIGSRLGA